MGLATAGATNLLLVTLLIPVSALALGAFVLGERLAWNAVVGMALIFLGLAAIDGRLFKAIGSRMRAMRRRDRDRECLLSLDARELRDIGLSRYDVLHEAGKPWWKP